MQTTHQEELNKMDMKFGSVHLIKHNKFIYGIADFTHCNKDDLMHNISKMLPLMEDKRHLVKCYDSDMSESDIPFWQFLKYDVLMQGQQLFVIREGRPSFITPMSTEILYNRAYNKAC